MFYQIRPTKALFETASASALTLLGISQYEALDRKNTPFQNNSKPKPELKLGFEKGNISIYVLCCTIEVIRFYCIVFVKTRQEFKSEFWRSY